MIETHFGWLPHGERTGEQIEAHDAAVGEMPKFASPSDSRGARVVLWEYARAANGGKHLPTLRQLTGSCVGCGATNAVWYLSAMEAVQLGERQRVTLPHMPYLYGRGRLHSGIRGRGDGSLGSGQAKAVRIDGVLPADAEGLRQPSLSGSQVSWTRLDEVEFSDGAAIDAKWVDRGNDHLVRTTAPVTSYEQVRDALANGYPVTVASMQGFRGNLGADFGEVDKGKRWGRAGGQWAHQMCFIGVDDDAGRPGCYCLNSWGPDAHGEPPDGAPPGGFWVDAEVVTRMVAQQDSFAWSQFDGFPAQQIDWSRI